MIIMKLHFLGRSSLLIYLTTRLLLNVALGCCSLQCRHLVGPLEFACWGNRVHVTILRPPFYRPCHVRQWGMGEGKNEKTPARDHCSNRKLHSPTNRVSDWCGSTLAVKSNSFVSFLRERNMANSVESGVVSFDFALDESLKFLCELGMS